MKLTQSMPFASKCVFREDFYSARHVQDNGGIITAATINKGVNSTGASGRIIYNGTNNNLINATEATWRVDVFWGTWGIKTLATKNNAANTDNQWWLRFVNGTLYLYIASSIGDIDNRAISGALAPGRNVVHFVYNGALAAASRVLPYVNGVFSTNGIAGTIPARMRATTYPVGLFNAYDGVSDAPSSDNIIYRFNIYSFAMSATEVAQDYANSTYQLVTP
jgi:hypothetical protein